MVFQKKFEERGSCQQYHELFQKSFETGTKNCTLDLLDLVAEKSLDVLKLLQCCSMVKPGWCALVNVG